MSSGEHIHKQRSSTQDTQDVWRK